jgi:hypothetical protein
MLYSLYKFFFLINCLTSFDFKKILKINKKKNLFFKKKPLTKVLLSRRLSIILKKKKIFKHFKYKKNDTGNFFFKKFFYKTILKNRKNLNTFLNLKKRTRQKKITQLFFKNSKHKFTLNQSYEYNVLNILLRSQISIFNKDLFSLFLYKYIFINGKQIQNTDVILTPGDCISLKVSKHYYTYMLISRKFLKKKITLFKFNSWIFFKNKFLNKKNQNKLKKRKTPKYLFLFFLFKLNIPSYLEVDYMTLSIFFLKKNHEYINSSYYLNKLFSFKLFSLYNFKKIN